MAFTAAYDNTEAQVCMTLSSIAYASENVPSKIKQAIIDNLANKSFATGGRWRLAWGPGLTKGNENLVYVAQDTTQPARYAVVIRGTDLCFLVNLTQDGDIFTQVPPGFGPTNQGILISEGAFDGLQDITSVTAQPAAGGAAVTFLQFLQSQFDKGGFDTFDIFVTGHSLGGNLASVTFPWIIAHWIGLPKMDLKVYTFAAPTAGNAAFASYVTSLSSGGAPFYYWAVANTRDLAPYAWGNLLDAALNDRIVRPVLSVGITVLSAVVFLNNELQSHKVSYQQPGAANTYNPPNNLDFSKTCGAPPVPTFTGFGCWVASEHATDTYLTLLGATPTNIAYTPDCPPAVAVVAEAAVGAADPRTQELIAQYKARRGEG